MGRGDMAIMRGMPPHYQAQTPYNPHMPEVQTNHSRALDNRGPAGYHPQSDELNLNDSRSLMAGSNYRPQYQQATFANTAGFGGISTLDSDQRAAPGTMAGNQPSDLHFRSKFARGMN